METGESWEKYRNGGIRGVNNVLPWPQIQRIRKKWKWMESLGSVAFTDLSVSFLLGDDVLSFLSFSFFCSRLYTFIPRLLHRVFFEIVSCFVILPITILSFPSRSFVLVNPVLISHFIQSRACVHAEVCFTCLAWIGTVSIGSIHSGTYWVGGIAATLHHVSHSAHTVAHMSKHLRLIGKMLHTQTRPWTRMCIGLVYTRTRLRSPVWLADPY